MGNLLFSPNGRIGSADFMKGGIILIIISILLGVLKHTNPGMGLMATLISLVLIYPWVCIWVKRLHNGGKSGATVLLYILLYVFLTIVMILVVMFVFGGAEFMEAVTEYSQGEISMMEYQAKVEAATQNIGMPAIAGGAIVSLLTLFIGDKTIPNDPDENHFGPAA